MHHGGEAGAGPARQATVPDAAALLLPDSGEGPGTCPLPSPQGPCATPPAFLLGEDISPHPPLPIRLGTTGEFRASLTYRLGINSI